MRKIVIFYISEFGGHNKAANNIKEALLYRNPALSVLSINGFGYFYPRIERAVDFFYTKLIKHFPLLWGKIYDRKKIIRGVNPFRRFVSNHTFKRLSNFIKETTPDCFVATQAFPCGLIADFKEKYKSKIPLIAVVTDYHPHGFWIHPSVDKYVVASAEAKEVLLKNGVAAEKIEIFGIPVSVKFLKSYERQEVAKEFKFIENLSSVLIMGGGLGIGPIKKIAQTLDSSKCNFQIIAVCGKNKKLYKWFEKYKSNFKKPVFYFSYVEFVDKIMNFADVIVTKSGGITISEALAKGLAIIITNPIPGQEERNVNYLLKTNSVLRADEPQLVGEYAKMFIEDREKMELFKKRARDISTPDSSLKIADLILKTTA